MEVGRSGHWVFDLDGTLTQPVHDFALIRAELEVPAGQDILTWLSALPVAEAAARHAWLWEHELALARRAVPASGALVLLRALQQSGAQLGLLTRNAKALAQVTLEAIGAEEFFAPHWIIGRDEAMPKPDPAGLQFFRQAWGVAAGQMRMVGDSDMDLACGRAAGVPTVLLLPAANPWPALADWHLRDCAALLAQLSLRSTA